MFFTNVNDLKYSTDAPISIEDNVATYDYDYVGAQLFATGPGEVSMEMYDGETLDTLHTATFPNVEDAHNSISDLVSQYIDN